LVEIIQILEKYGGSALIKNKNDDSSLYLAIKEEKK
jgi:hypothetical protein